jgi:hypothetical protein
VAWTSTAGARGGGAGARCEPRWRARDGGAHGGEARHQRGGGRCGIEADAEEERMPAGVWWGMTGLGFRGSGTPKNKSSSDGYYDVINVRRYCGYIRCYCSYARRYKFLKNRV